MNRTWKRLLSMVLSFAMVLTMAVIPVTGEKTAQAAGDAFTLYFYYEGTQTLYMDIWNHAGITFADTAVTSSEWGWPHSQAVLQAVEGKANWYQTEIKILSSESDGFDIYAGASGDDNKIATYDDTWHNTEDYAVLVGGTKTAYAIKDGAIVSAKDEGLVEDDGNASGDGNGVVKDAEIDVAKVSGLSDDFCMGVDISSVISEFESGVTFKDYDGKVIDNVDDFCAFLASTGITNVRVRVWNDPKDKDGNGYGGGNNDTETAKKITDACRKAGLKVLIDFHCSDFWADPSKQMVPKAWKDYTVEQKEAAVEEFIKNSLEIIDPAKDTVTMVQVGNETNNKFIGESGAETMCKLFSAGAKGVRAYNDKVKVVIHVTNPESGMVSTWAENLDTYKVDYDVLASSYYPYWHGSLSNLTSELKNAKDTYGKDVMVAETSYAFTLEDTDGHANTVRVGKNDTGDNLTEPFSEQGQATAVRNVINAVSAAGGIGVFYWEPAWITVGDVSGLDADSAAYKEKVDANKKLWESKGSGWAASYAGEYDPDDAGLWYGGSPIDNEAMFHKDGTPTASLHVWEYVRTGAESKYTILDKIADTEETIEFGGTYALPATIKVTYNKGSVDETVTWDQADVAKIDVNKAGTYVVNGTVALSKTVDAGDYKGQTTVKATYTLTVKEKNYLLNGGFENGDANWTITGTGAEIAGNDPHSGTSGLHFWSEAAFSYKAAQTVKLPAGTYTLGGFLQGGDAGADDRYEITLLAGSRTETVKAELKGWNEWQNPEIKDITFTEETQVTVEITGNGSAQAWGTWDDIYITGKEASVSPAPTPAPAAKNVCKKVKAAKKTYTIKKKGKTVKTVFKITAADNTKKTTDKLTVKIKNKKIAKVTKKTLKKGKAVIIVKGVKKGKTTLTVKVGTKSAKVTIKVKK